jgi:hypothetical protein
MERTELILKNAKARGYYLGVLLLAFLIFAIQLVLAYAIYHEHYGRLMASVGIVLIMLLVRRGDKYNYGQKMSNISFAYALVLMNWLSWDLYWAAGLTLLPFILYTFATKKFKVIVSGKEIAFPSFPEKKIQWNELQNVVIKDELLTIDFKNNKIIQQEIEGDDDFNEKKFNDFCRVQLIK